MERTFPMHEPAKKIDESRWPKNVKCETTCFSPFSVQKMISCEIFMRMQLAIWLPRMPLGFVSVGKNIFWKMKHFHECTQKLVTKRYPHDYYQAQPYKSERRKKESRKNIYKLHHTKKFTDAHTHILCTYRVENRYAEGMKKSGTFFQCGQLLSGLYKECMFHKGELTVCYELPSRTHNRSLLLQKIYKNFFVDTILEKKYIFVSFEVLSSSYQNVAYRHEGTN